MNRSEAIAIMRRRGDSSVTPSSFHFANVNASKDVWWLDIPIGKFSHSGDSKIGLLLYDQRPNLLYVLEVPKSYFRDHVRDLVVRREKGCISLELSTERGRMFRDVRPTGGGVPFGQFLTDTISYVGLDALIKMPGVPNGMGAVLFRKGGQPQCLEIFTYGDDHWEGVYDGFAIEQTA